jgi:hypothetical protein
MSHSVALCCISPLLYGYTLLLFYFLRVAEGGVCVTLCNILLHPYQKLAETRAACGPPTPSPAAPERRASKLHRPAENTIS